jgi:N-carbamoyl-L-amino-acid hydrolase
MQLDQRHLDPKELAAMFAEAREACRNAAEEFNCTVEERDIFRAAPTPFDATLVGLARTSIEEAGGDAGEPIPSGPLHDATEIGRVVPTAMIFAQSDPPISHASIEDSPEPALRVAIEAYGRTVERVLANASKGAG